MMKDWLFAARITVHCLTGCVIGELIGLILAIPAGYFAALPVNYWLVKKASKAMPLSLNNNVMVPLAGLEPARP